jgi:L-ascorbate metabolism protein UlaG (beta-lactamase superfamily)
VKLKKHFGAALLALGTGSLVFATASLANDSRDGDRNRGGNDDNSINDPRFVKLSSEPACNTTIMASTGGPTARNPKTLVIRWMGYTNYELIYGDKIILLDQYYDRAGTQYKDLGFTPSEVKRADLMIVGHAHYDHMSDTATVGAQTRAPILGAPITIGKLMTQPVNQKQLVTVTGTDGKILRYPNIGITVQPILGKHGQPPAFTKAFGTAYGAAMPVPTPSEAAAQAAIQARGSTDPNIVTEGTIAFVITFEDGFRLAYRDSGGVMTQNEIDAMNKLGAVDVLLGAVAANDIAESNAMILLPMVENYRPEVYFPGHHEEHTADTVDRATEPLFQYVKNILPDTVTISKEFREPTCFDTTRNLARGNAAHQGFIGNLPSNANLQEWDVQGVFF